MAHEFFDAKVLTGTRGSRSAAPDVEEFKPRLQGQKQVMRYRPGQAPVWETADGARPADGLVSDEATAPAVAPQGGVPSGRQAAASAAAVLADPKLARILQRKRAEASTMAADPAAGGARLATGSDVSSDEDDGPSAAAAGAADRSRARARARARALANSREAAVPSGPPAGIGQGGGAVAEASAILLEAPAAAAPAAVPAPASRGAFVARVARADDVSSSSDGGDSDTDSSDASDGGVGAASRAFRPVFRSKADRTTRRTAEELEAEAEEEARRKEEERAVRVRETRALVADEVMRETEAAAAAEAAAQDAAEDGRPDDTDRPEEEEAEYEAWKVRELARLRRDADEVAEARREREETERRRGMSDRQRMAEDDDLRARGLLPARPDRGAPRERRMMQKFTHRGAFYMDEDSIKDADDVRRRAGEYAAAATGADRVDKSALPKVMHVRDFGKRSRTKWTHLSAEDTSLRRDDALGVDRAAQRRYDARRGGVGRIDGSTRRGRR